MVPDKEEEEEKKEPLILRKKYKNEKERTKDIFRK
jgi:hypothetical protein